MKFVGIFLACVAAAAPTMHATAASAGKEAAVAAVHRFIDAFDKGDAKSAAEQLTASPIIIDEVAPHLWQGSKAFVGWTADLDKHDKAAGMSAQKVTLGSLARTVLSGTHAYVVVPADYSYVKKGVAMHEAGQMTFVLSSAGAVWKIASLTWTGPEAVPVK